MKKAIYLGKVEHMASDARLYRLIDPPFFCGRRKRCYVVVSGADLCYTVGLSPDYFDDQFTPRYETFIFRSSRKGYILKWDPMEGSFKGEIDHARALAGLGYEEINKIPTSQ